MPDASKGQKVLFVSEGTGFLTFSWALYPRPILFLNVNHVQSPKSKDVVCKFNPRYVIIRETINDEVEKSLPLVLKKISSAPDRLYEVVQN